MLLDYGLSIFENPNQHLFVEELKNMIFCQQRSLVDKALQLGLKFESAAKVTYQQMAEDALMALQEGRKAAESKVTA